MRRYFDTLGPMADPARRGELMHAAHQAFDPIWQSGLVSRTTAYKMLARQLGVPGFYAHISRMHSVQLEAIPNMVAAMTYEIHEKYRR